MPSIRSASGASDPNSRSFLNVGSLPTGWQPGDVVFIVLCNGASLSSYTSTGGDWTFLTAAGNQNNGGAAMTSNVCYRTMQSGDTWPLGSSGGGVGIEWSSSGRYSVVAVCVQPDVGDGTLTVASAASPTIGSTAATTFTAPSYSAGADTGLSLLLNAARAFNNGSTAITHTAPTNWTEPTNADSSTASGTNAASRQVATSGSGRTGQTGTISPGAATFAGAGSPGNVTANLYHLFINGGGGGGGPVFDSKFLPFFM